MPTFRNFTDTRDGKVYKIVLMPDGKWWSAENLVWNGAGILESGNRYFFASDLMTCCPPGTHTPSRTDWQVLYASLPSPKGGQLKTTSGWDTQNPYYPSVQGFDTYGFNVLPVGNYNTPYVAGIPLFAYIAMTPDYDLNSWGCAIMRAHENDTLDITAFSINTTTAFSVRFIVDIVDAPTTSLSSGKYYTKQKVTLSHPTLPIYYDTI